MSNTIRIKRRSGLSGAPEQLWGAELAYNEFDHILFIGEGTGGTGGTASVIAPIAGPGAYVTRGVAGTAQTIDGLKTFTSNVAINADKLTSTSSTFGILPTSTTINIGALTGYTTVRNNLNVDRDFFVSGTSKFTGNVEIGQDLAINGGDITSTSILFNLLEYDVETINFGGDATVINIGASTGKLTIANANTNITGFLYVDKNARVKGDLEVSGGDITTNNSAATLFNANATTVSAFGDASVISIGSASGSTTINNNLGVNGGSITSSTATFNIVSSGVLALNIGNEATAISIGNTSGKTTINNANTEIVGFLSVDSSAKVAYDLAVNGGDITTTALIATLFNDNATTVSAFGDATSISIGSGSGKTTINNANTDISGFLHVDGDTRLVGDLEVSGGDITSSSSVFNILPTSTTVNIGAAATEFNIGAGTGVTTVKNNIVVNGTSTFTANAEFSGSVVVQGDLAVNGTFTTINSTIVSVDDKNLELGSTDDPTNDTADGGGITLKGSTDKTIIWDKLNNNWTSSENWNLASGKVYKIDNTSVLSNDTLGSGVIYSSLQTVGVISSGTWQASTVAAIYGGTGYSSYTKGDMLWANSGSTLAKLGIGTYDADNGVGQMLQVGPNNIVRWSNIIDGGTY